LGSRERDRQRESLRPRTHKKKAKQGETKKEMRANAITRVYANQHQKHWGLGAGKKIPERGYQKYENPPEGKKYNALV